MPPSLRPAVFTDAPAIEQLLVASSLPTDGVAEMLANDPAQFVVAVGDGNDVEAIAALECVGEFALLRSVAVRPTWRGTGLGQRIVQHAINAADERGVRALYLLTTTAAEWFPRFGFAVVERSSVPEAVRETVEFKSACPASATVMARARERQ